MKNHNTKKSVIETEVEILHKLKIEKEKRASLCWKEIETSLNKYKCDLVPSMQLTAEGIQSFIDVKAK